MRRLAAPLLLALLCASASSLTGESGLYVSRPGKDAAPIGAEATSARLSDSILGRFETVAVGSFPLAMLYVGLGYDVGNWGFHAFDPIYAPWPFKSSLAPALSSDQRVLELGLAVGLSLIAATVDGLIHWLPRRNPKTDLPEEVSNAAASGSSGAGPGAAAPPEADGKGLGADASPAAPGTEGQP